MATEIRVNRLKGLIDQHGLGVGQVAYRTSISAAHIYRILAGERPNPSAAILGALAQALDTTTDYLLGLTDNPLPSAESAALRSQLEYELLQEFRKLEDLEDKRYALAQLRLHVRHSGPHMPRIIGNEPQQSDDESIT